MEVVIRSIPVYYEEYGSGIPLLMLHGGGIDHRLMVSDMEPTFQKRSGWRRIYPDLPGHGKTPGADWITNQDDVLEVVTDFIKTVAPNQHFVVAGYSYGGYLARGLVYKYGTELNGVLLVEPVVETDPDKKQLPLHQVLVEDEQFQAALRTDEKNHLGNYHVIQSVEALERSRTYVQPALALADFTFFEKDME